MPRHAKGSLPEAIYSDLLSEMMIDQNAPRQKRNHMEDVGINPLDRVRGVKATCRLHDMGWINTDNFLMVVGDIVKGH